MRIKEVAPMSSTRRIIFKYYQQAFLEQLHYNNLKSRKKEIIHETIQETLTRLIAFKCVTIITVTEIQIKKVTVET